MQKQISFFEKQNKITSKNISKTKKFLKKKN